MAARHFTKIFFVGLTLFAPALVIAEPASSDSLAAVRQWQEFEISVRDGLLKKEAARQKLPAILNALKNWANQFSFEESPSWDFPIRDYSLQSVGGKSGNGYQPDSYYGQSIRGYDFFDGNKHGGHPAHDIFIRDKNQDCLDDQTGKPVETLAMVDSVVVQTETSWNEKSPLRGGNVVWLYNPKLDMMFYYAHLKNISVQPGQFVKQGTAIGEIGRSGKSAAEKRSPTHLHLMVLKNEAVLLKPYNFYMRLPSHMK